MWDSIIIHTKKVIFTSTQPQDDLWNETIMLHLTNCKTHKMTVKSGSKEAGERVIQPCLQVTTVLPYKRRPLNL